jgi:membrane associated rhomboid family serine protease
MIPFRDENPTRIFPFVTWALIILNLLVFLWEINGGIGEARGRLVGPLAGWTLVPAEITTGQDHPINGPSLQPLWLTLFTCMFMHSGWMHFLGNMLFLFIFGNNIEDALGHVKFVVFYLVCGLIASASQILAQTNSIVPNLGASGAIAGVLGAYLVLYPRARVNTLVFLGIFITTIRVPAFVLLGFWIASQFFSQVTQSMISGADRGGVAYLAHIGGFVAGMVLIKLFGARPTPPDFDGGYRPREYRYGPPRYVNIRR